MSLALLSKLRNDRNNTGKRQSVQMPAMIKIDAISMDKIPPRLETTTGAVMTLPRFSYV